MSNVIIVGGGKVGYYLLKSLKNQNRITLIEKSRDLCERLAGELEATIICGDGTSLEVLSDSSVQNADAVIAVTGKDEENLIICQLAKMNFGVDNTIARVNNPKNSELFRQLGVDKTVCSTEVIVNWLEKTF